MPRDLPNPALLRPPKAGIRVAEMGVYMSRRPGGIKEHIPELLDAAPDAIVIVGGAAGSVVNVITKAGTNQFHGSAFWFHNDNHLNSRSNLDKQLFSSSPFRTENQFHVYAYSLPDLKLLGGVHVGNHPDWLTFTPDSKTVYVANAGSNSVSAVDIASRKESARIPVGQVPKRNITSVWP